MLIRNNRVLEGWATTIGKGDETGNSLARGQKDGGEAWTPEIR